MQGVPARGSAFSDPARPIVKPRARAACVKAASLSGEIRSGSEPSPLPTVSSMTPAAPVRAAIPIASNSGKASANKTKMRRVRAASVASRLKQHSARASWKETELDVVYAARRNRQHRGANSILFERQVADGGADRHAASDRSDASVHGLWRESAEGSPAGIFEVDDIGAGADRHFGFGGIAHACQEQGHPSALSGKKRGGAISGTAN